MIKFFIGLLLAVGTVVRAEDIVTSALAPYDSRGVSITKFFEGTTLDYQVENAEPFYVTSIAVGGSVDITNTISLLVVRVYGITEQVRPDAVTTNIFGQVETNYYGQVTNYVYRVTTNMIHTATVTNDAIFAVTIPFMYKNDDVLRVSQTDTNGKPIIISGQR